MMSVRQKDERETFASDCNGKDNEKCIHCPRR